MGWEKECEDFLALPDAVDGELFDTEGADAEEFRALRRLPLTICHSS